MTDAALSGLRAILGDDGVITDLAERELVSQDIFYKGALCLAVLKPAAVEPLAAAVAFCKGQGLAIHPRGGGLSYTGGYLAGSADAVVIDLQGLNRIVSISPQDMMVTVEAGVTWTQLHAALSPLGLTTPYWGPLSGVRATIGGALSQNSVFWGSGLNGLAGDSALSLDVVLADGTVLSTGSAGLRDTPSFLRSYGPDLTGLFIGDSGALGLKVRATLRLVPRAAHRRYLSLSYPSAAALTAGMSEVARAQLASETFAMDPYLTNLRTSAPAGLASDLKSLWDVARSAGPLQAARIALSGRRFAKAIQWGHHLILEDGTSAGALDRERRARAIGLHHGAVEVEASVPKLMAASPFPAPRGVLGPKGEMWAPIHVILPHSRATAFCAQYEAWAAENAALLDAHGVKLGVLYLTAGTTAFVIEIMMFWPGARSALHDQALGPAAAGRVPRLADDPAARETVLKARGQILAIGDALGAAHMQIGRTYDYRQVQTPEASHLLDAIKAAVDSAGLMNPGALGLPDKR